MRQGQRRTLNNSVILMAQITPSVVKRTSTEPETADASPSGRAPQEAGVLDIIKRGVVQSWEGLESILYDVLHSQVQLRAMLHVRRAEPLSRST